MPVQSGSPSGGLFRQAALDRINSPEQLDRLLTVTTARSWIALMAAAMLIAAALIWSLFGHLSSYVEGRGLFLPAGGSLVAAAAPGLGTLEQVLVKKGDRIKEDQVLAVISARDLEQQIASYRALVAEREQELDRQRRFADQEIAAKRSAVELREAALRRIEADALRRAQVLKTKLADEQRLLADRVVTRTTVLQTQSQLDQATQEAATEHDQITQLDIQLRDLAFQADQRVKSAEFELAAAQRQLNDRTEAYRAGAEVLAPVEGTVDEIQLYTGSIVSRGQSVMTIETPGQGLEFVLFVPLTDGNKIEPGQAVRIAPNWTTREEEGTMLGRVTEVSKFPITPEGMGSLLAHEHLVKEFSRIGPVFVVHVELTRDPESRSGYAWTSSRGAKVYVESGDFAGGEVEVKVQRPISLAIPAVRRWTGI